MIETFIFHFHIFTVVSLTMRFIVSLVALSAVCASVNLSGRWSVEKAAKWQSEIGWKAGANFIPSTAVNELEMFQEETYDVETIDRELQFAENVGFGMIRVFLHNLLWSQNPAGFLKRLDNFLALTEKHKIGVMFVLFDSCWKPYPEVGTQPDPTPGVHNSQWVQCPGEEFIYTDDENKFDSLYSYVHGVVNYLKDDTRVVAWDIWNEPNNSGYADDVIAPLLQKVVNWMHKIAPSQPITTPIWQDVEIYNYTAFQKLQLDVSDVISYHNYNNVTHMAAAIANLKDYAPGRPIVCTEYMARPMDSTFDPHLELMQSEGVYALNWGFVSGKTQTIYSWDTNTTPATEEPAVWFHDIFRANGTAFRQLEVDYITDVIKKGAAANIKDKK